jgi:hypothetical protein
MIVEIDLCSLAAAAIPHEHETPALIDPDRTPSRQVAGQFLEMIARRGAQVRIRGRIVDDLKFPKEAGRNVSWNSLGVNVQNEKVMPPVIPEASDHVRMYHAIGQIASKLTGFRRHPHPAFSSTGVIFSDVTRFRARRTTSKRKP